MKRTALLAALVVLSDASSVRGDEPAAAVSLSGEPAAAAPRFYVSAFLGTTLLTRPAAGELRGPSQDLSPMVGLGYLLTVAAVPGVGFSYTFKSGWAPFAELDGVILRNPTGGADLSAAVSIGVARSF